MDRPTPQIQVIVGSTRPSRSGEQVARWVASLADARGDLEVELVDLRDWPLPFFDSPVSPRKAISDDPRVQAWAAQVASADGYVLVTPEYNAGYSAVLKNALDHLAAPWSGKPVGLVGYGGGAAPGGGNRAVRQLREVVETLGMRPTQAPVVLPRVWAAFGDDGRPSEDAHAVAASTMLDELVQRLSDRRLEAVPVSA